MPILDLINFGRVHPDQKELLEKADPNEVANVIALPYHDRITNNSSVHLRAIT